MDGDAGARGEGRLSPLPNEAGCKNFGEDEEDLIIKLHALLGDRWSLIAGRLPGRTDNEVKNHWDSYLKGKLINMGIDPENHRLPRIRPVENSGDTDQVSDVAPHLNLGLSMTSISSPSPSFNNEVLQQHVDSKDGQETRSRSSPTLLLFK